MSAGSSVPVEILQGTMKSKPFSKGKALTDDVEQKDMSLLTFKGEVDASAVKIEGCTATERDLLLMEHLPTVRYLARPCSVRSRSCGLYEQQILHHQELQCCFLE